MPFASRTYMDSRRHLATNPTFDCMNPDGAEPDTPSIKTIAANAVCLEILNDVRGLPGKGLWRGTPARVASPTRQPWRGTIRSARLRRAPLAFMIDLASEGEMLCFFGRALLPVTAVLMTIIGLFATIGPARRGLRIQPNEALRAE